MGTVTHAICLHTSHTNIVTHVVIIEGMDGSGKTRLFNHLADVMNIERHPRAATWEGPIDDRFGWAQHDVETWSKQPFSIYDRHPLISEYIYGPILRGTMDPRFHGIEAKNLLKRFAFGSVIVFCDPGVVSIKRNVENDQTPQMIGVRDHVHQLTMAYRSWYINYQAPLRVIRWDYANPGNLATIKHLVDAQRVAHERLALHV